MRVFLTALGCKLNQAEISHMARQIVSRGHHVVDDPTEADWAIINTCTVTHIAARKSRQLARSLHRRAPRVRIALTGCYAEMSPSDLASLDGVELVVSNPAKETIVDAILSTADGPPMAETCVSGLAPRDLDGHTRAFVKVQDGCDNHCAYCIVTVARGPARSVPADHAVESVRRRVDEGYREVVLTGINIGAYGRERSGSEGSDREGSLAGLVRRILSETSVERLRLSSIEPPDLTPELVSLWPEARLCRHVHLALQSGCDATLRAMRRQYTSGQFAESVGMLRRAVPGVSLTTDIIVGFPGETMEQFDESLRFCQDMQFARMHVFKFSKREGTLAARMPNQVAPQVAQDRSERMIALGREMAAIYHAQFVGKTTFVLAETDRLLDGRRVWNGLTDTYVRTTFPCVHDVSNRLISVRVDRADAQGLEGQVVTVSNPGC